MNNELIDILKTYQTVSLKEMDSVKLMNRVDTKFFFHTNHLKTILEKACDYYKILEIKHQSQFQYTTTYFDTPDLIFYHNHHNGKLNRYKVRQRRYEITGAEYFEIKFKSNKGLTLKSRIINNSRQYLNQNTDSFLKIKTPYSIAHLQPVLANNFIRITLAGKQLCERITLDYNISFLKSFEKYAFPQLAIAEVKQSNHLSHSMFLKIMKNLNIRPERISKYCLGIPLFYKGVKANRFKPQIEKIKKL